MVRFGIAAWCLDVQGPEALWRAARLGLTRVQLEAGVPGDRHHVASTGTLEAYRRAREESGVTLIGMGAKAVNDLGMTAPEGTEAERRCRDVMRTALEAAAALEIGFVFFPSFRASEIRDEPGLRRTARLLKWACRQAAPHGIQLGSENSLGAEGNLRLAGAVDEPNFRIVLDSYNPVLHGHRVPPLVTALGPHLAGQVHAKDGLGGRMGSAPLGRGEAGFLETMEALKQRRFDGDLVLENDYRQETEARVADDLATLVRLFGTAAGRQTPAPGAGQPIQETSS